MFAVSLGLMAVVPTLGLYIEERFGLTGDRLQTWTGLVYAAAPLTAALLGPFWGILGDRVGRKVMVVRASLGIGTAMGLMPLAPSPAWLLALRIFQGAFAGFVAPAMVLGTAGIPREREGRAIGRLQLALAMGLLIGPAVGGQIAYAFDRAAVFYFTSALSLASMLPVVFLASELPAEAPAEAPAELPARVPAKVPVEEPPAEQEPAPRGGLGNLFGSPIFLALLVGIFLLRFGQHMVEPYVSLWVRELGVHPILLDLAGDPREALEWTIAVAFGVLAIAQLLFTTGWGRLADAIGPLRCLAAVGLGLALIFFLTAIATSIEGFLVLRCFAAVFMAGGMTLSYAAVARRVGPECKSLAFSLVQSGMQLGLSLGPVLGDLIAHRIAADAGMAGLYFTGGTCLAVAGVGMMVLRVVSTPRTAKHPQT